MRAWVMGLMLAGVSIPAAAGAAGGDPVVEERGIVDLQAAMTAGTASSVDLVQAYRRRIAGMDRAGPTLRSVIMLNPDALTQARLLDAERRRGRVRGCAGRCTVSPS